MSGRVATTSLDAREIVLTSTSNRGISPNQDGTRHAVAPPRATDVGWPPARSRPQAFAWPSSERPPPLATAARLCPSAPRHPANGARDQLPPIPPCLPGGTKRAGAGVPRRFPRSAFLRSSESCPSRDRSRRRWRARTRSSRPRDPGRPRGEPRPPPSWSRLGRPLPRPVADDPESGPTRARVRPDEPSEARGRRRRRSVLIGAVVPRLARSGGDSDDGGASCSCADLARVRRVETARARGGRRASAFRMTAAGDEVRFLRPRLRVPRLTESRFAHTGATRPPSPLTRARAPAPPPPAPAAPP